MDKKNTEKAPRRQPGRAASGRRAADNASQTPRTPEMIRAEKRKAAQKKMLLNNLKYISIVLVVVAAISATIAYFVISCVNDILAIHVPEKDRQSVVIEIREGMNTQQVIDTLAEAGVIRNAWFCDFVAENILGYSDEGYNARTYEFNRSMGLENMLNEIKNNNSSAAQTVTLTFPEGYNADQIIDLLAEKGVCSREKLIEAINIVDFASEFEFLESITNRSQRYNYLEGFLFPDTYEFYIGEDPASVIKKFLNNFDNKWTENYSDKADALGMNIDEVVRLASVIEKEAIGEDMPVVASILLNRIDAGMRLECDSTSLYAGLNTSGLTADEIAAYDNVYDTYICGSLPIGSICNPGIEAIDAVLNAADTSYYYFIHDRDNTLRVAKTLSEHENNIATYGLASS